MQTRRRSPPSHRISYPEVAVVNELHIGELLLIIDEMQKKVLYFIDLNESLMERISRLEGYSNMETEILSLRKIGQRMQREVLMYRQLTFLLKKAVQSYEKNEREVSEGYDSG